jgi:hypothetical protein
LNRWSARVPVELSNRELHREGWEHDGVCLKVAVADTSVLQQSVLPRHLCVVAARAKASMPVQVKSIVGGVEGGE